MFPDLLRDDVFRLETPRLWLRWPRAADAAALVRLGGDPQVASMTASVPQPYRPEDAAKLVFASRAGNAQGSSLVLVLTPKRKPTPTSSAPSGCMVGATTPRCSASWLGAPFQGQGLMSEAAGAVVDLASPWERSTRSTPRRASRTPPPGACSRRPRFRLEGRGPIHLPARGGVFVCDRFRRDHGWGGR